MTRLAAALLCAVALAAADPYDAWTQGRPGEALQGLLAGARAQARWDAWLDAGLAAAAAGDRGAAVACLAEAMNLAPERLEPRAALRALGQDLPQSWSERAGPLGLPGQGWAAVALLGLAGLALGAGLTWRRRRGLLLAIAGLAAAAAAPGQAAVWADGRLRWLGTVRDSAALDSTGTPLRALPAGTLLQRAGGTAWAGRALVRLEDGALAYVALADAAP